MNNNFNLKQFLAEGTLLKEETSPLDNLEAWLKESLQDFDTNPGNPYWKGINNILNSPKVFDYILERCEGVIEDYKEDYKGKDEDLGYLQMILGDAIELEVMDYFWPTFLENLYDDGITKYGEDDTTFFLDPKSSAFNKATINNDPNFSKKGGGQFSTMEASEVFDLLNFMSDIGENVLMSWENFLNENQEDVYDVKYDI